MFCREDGFQGDDGAEHAVWAGIGMRNAGFLRGKLHPPQIIEFSGSCVTLCFVWDAILIRQVELLHIEVKKSSAARSDCVVLGIARPKLMTWEWRREKRFAI